jgi:hypothetical protein
VDAGNGARNIRERTVVIQQFAANRSGLGVALDSFRRNVLDDPYDLVQASAAGFENGGDLRPRGARLLAHATLDDHLARVGVVLGSRMAREHHPIAGAKPERERVPRIIVPGKITRFERDSFHPSFPRRSPGLNRRR